MSRSFLPAPVEQTALHQPPASDGHDLKVIPVLRPRLPATKDLLPYLQAIDGQAWYSNYGPLVTSLEVQLTRYLGATGGAVTTASSGTCALTATLLALPLPPNSECLMPSWTFAATPHAARAAGLTPFFHDIDRHTWALNPEEVLSTLQRTPRQIAAVIVVSPFGAPLEIAAWRKLQVETGLRVVIDAAAGFDTLRLSSIPAIVSLHATKILGAGEGGFVATSDSSLLERIKTCSNFGFNGSRVATLPAINSKMSEYHAAAALANLDAWPTTRSEHLRIAERYRHALEKLDGITLQPGSASGWVSSTTNIVLPSDSVVLIAQHLMRTGIETRSWWGQGCHVQPAFRECPRTAMPVTEDLGSRVLGLPHYADLRNEEIDQVISALSAALLPGRHKGSAQ